MEYKYVMRKTSKNFTDFIFGRIVLKKIHPQKEIVPKNKIIKILVNSNKMLVEKQFKVKIEEDEKKTRTIDEVMAIALEYKNKLHEYRQANGQPYAPTSINHKYSDMNNIVKEHYGEAYRDETVKVLVPERAVKKKQMEDVRKKNIKRLKERMEFDYIDYLEKIDELKEKKDYWSMMALANIVSGRRLTEIAKTGEFKEIKGEPQYVSFSGALKKRTEVERKEIHKIPIISLTAKQFLNLMKKIRKEKDLSKRKNVDVANLVGDRTNAVLKKTFNRKLTSETMRTNYAWICYRLYNDDPKVSELIYGAEILVHTPTDIATFSNNYSYTFFTNLEMRGKADEKAKVEESLNDAIKHLEKL